jgi:hypothetical protein
MHSHTALFCEVCVNSVTGELRVSRFLGSFDCGRIVNANTVASQFRGGIIMGLGLALMEEVMFDERSGRIMNPSLAEYHVPVHLDVPEIDVIWTDEPDPAPVIRGRRRSRRLQASAKGQAEMPSSFSRAVMRRGETQPAAPANRPVRLYAPS